EFFGGKRAAHSWALLCGYPARRAHWLDRRRPCAAAGQGCDLRQLDQERRRLGHRRSQRPSGSARRRASALVEFSAPLARLQRGGLEKHWRRWLALLLRGELMR